MSSFEGLIEQIRQTGEQFGRIAIDPLVDEVVQQIANASNLESCPVSKLLKTLRGVRSFDHLLRVTKALLDAGYRKPPTLIYRAQAMIEQGRLDDAESLLADLLKDAKQKQLSSSHSEAAGLLGRLNKQRFVLQINDNKEAAANHLRSAIEFHKGAYHHDRVWHGPNIVALAWRARREGIEVGVDCEVFASKLLTSIEDDVAASAATTADAWQKAAQAQAYMALEQWDQAASLYRDYLQVASDAFTLNGDFRQLVEIWCLGPDDGHERADILVNVAGRALQLPNGYMVQDPAMLQRLAYRAGCLQQETRERQPQNAENQALIDNSKLITYQTLMDLGKQSCFICQVVHADRHARGRVSGGSGFLAHLGFFKNGASGPVVVTNAHVLAEMPGPDVIGRDQGLVLFHNWQGTGKTAKFKIAEIVWFSPQEEHDVCIARLEDVPDTLETAPIFDKAYAAYAVPDGNLKQELGRAYTIGHPQGRGIEFGLETPQVLDHELHVNGDGVRRLHYRTPTERGSSGGPVFHGGDLRVIGIHRRFETKPIPNSCKPFGKPYAANEAVGIHAVAHRSRTEI